MKFTTIYLDKNKIEIVSSFAGKETIKVNDEVVSQKYSAFGARHSFFITENGEKVACNLNMGYGLNGVVFDLYKNEKPIVVSEKSGCLPTLFVFILIALIYEVVKSFF